MTSIISILSGFFTSALICLFILLFNGRHIHISGDNHFHLPQKIHNQPIPRVGGLAIFIGLIIGVLLQKSALYNYQTLIIALVAPAFFIGIYEDLSKKVSPLLRFIFIGLSATLEIYINKVMIHDVGIPGLDSLLKIELISFLFTLFCIVGVTNAYNICDGLNGLAALLSLSALIVVFIISYYLRDNLLLYLSLLTASAIAGFIIFNFPLGKIFLGDGGAYLIGMQIALLSILLVSRGQNISPWLAIVINIYPITETLFSVYRRGRDHEASITSADHSHMHSLLYLWVNESRHPQIRRYSNPIATIIIAAPSIAVCALAIVFYESSFALFLISLFYFAFYAFIYKNLVSLKDL